MNTVTLARHAMATRFELVLHGEDPVRLRAAGEEALDEIDRLEAQLSLFRPTSEIAHVNARASKQPVRVSPEVFSLLVRARDLQLETQGMFDITVAPLVRCWGFMEGSGERPGPEQLRAARASIGMNLVELEPSGFTVRFKREGVMLDLGAIGKGHAIERAAEFLREAGVGSGLIHGGTSTVYGLGRPPHADSWLVAVENPKTGLKPHVVAGEAARGELAPLATVPLTNESLSVSAVWGKCFEVNGKVLGHVLDPRTGAPVAGAVLAAVILPSATETDALSTALLVAGLEDHDRVTRLRPGMRSLVVAESSGGFEARARGVTVRPL